MCAVICFVTAENATPEKEVYEPETFTAYSWYEHMSMPLSEQRLPLTALFFFQKVTKKWAQVSLLMPTMGMMKRLQLQKVCLYLIERVRNVHPKPIRAS